MQHLDLTEKQKDLLRWLVESVRAELVPEEFVVEWDRRRHIGLISTLNADEDLEIPGITKSALDALARAGFITQASDLHQFPDDIVETERRCSLTSRAYRAVDCQFQVEALSAQEDAGEKLEEGTKSTVHIKFFGVEVEVPLPLPITIGIGVLALVVAVWWHWPAVLDRLSAADTSLPSVSGPADPVPPEAGPASNVVELELTTKDLHRRLDDAEAYRLAGGSPANTGRALELYREVVEALSERAVDALGQQLLESAESSYRQRHHDDALAFYTALFKPYVRTPNQ